MEAGRTRNQQTKMRGCINQDNKLTDIYLPRKCDYTDKLITPKDNSSIQLSIADVPFMFIIAQLRRYYQSRKNIFDHYLWIR
jgi:hypothetical protein